MGGGRRGILAQNSLRDKMLAPSIILAPGVRTAFRTMASYGTLPEQPAAPPRRRVSLLSAGGVATAVVAATALLFVVTQPVRLPHPARRRSDVPAVQPPWRAGVSPGTLWLTWRRRWRACFFCACGWLLLLCERLQTHSILVRVEEWETC